MKVLMASEKWSNTVGEPWAIASIQALANELRAWFLEASHGKCVLEITVTPWVRNKQDDVGPECSTGMSRATAVGLQLMALGINVLAFDKGIYITPQFPGCGPRGFAFIGGDEVWMNSGPPTLYNLIHELGHTLGLAHTLTLRAGTFDGNTLTFPSLDVSPWGGRDPGYFSPMPSKGFYWPCSFSAPEKEKLGWIVPALYLGGDQTYTLTALSVPGGALYVVKIVRGKRTYWIEYRRSLGLDTSPWSAIYGVQIWVAGVFGCNPYALIYSRVETLDTQNYEAFRVGEHFVDGVIDIHFVSESANAAVVRISPVAAIVIPPPVEVIIPPASTGNTQMAIDDYKAKANALTLGQITAGQLAILDAARALIVPDIAAPAGSDSPSGTSVPPASSITALGGTWTLGGVGNPPILKNGVQAGDGRADKILWKAGGMYALAGGSSWYRWTGTGWVACAAP